MPELAIGRNSPGPPMVELVLPLAITVLVAQNAQGFAVLGGAGLKPPVNAVTTACGLGSLISATVGVGTDLPYHRAAA